MTEGKTIRELYPRAFCHDCDWEGPREELKEGDGVIDELCPKCNSDATEWIPARQRKR